MKKFLFITLISIISYVSLPVNVYAATSLPDPVDTACTSSPNAAFCKEKNPSENPLFGPNGILTNIAQFLTIVSGIIAVFIVTYGGLRYVMSGGEPQKLTSARNTILYGVIGVVVVIIAQTIVSFVLRKI